MMVSSVEAYWTVFVVVALSFHGVHSLTVKVSPIISTDLNATNLTLPCEYVLKDPDHTCNIRWEKEEDTVIVKDSAGQIIVGDNYKNRVSWGYNCSLILLYPGLKDMGRYTFTAVASYDRKNIRSAHTKVTVGIEDKRSRETTTGVYRVTSTSQTIDPNTFAVEDGHTSLAWVQHVPLTALSVAHVVLMWCSERRGFTDIKHRLLLGGVLVLFIIGDITGIVGIALGNTVVIVVGQYFVYLGIVGHIIRAFWFIKAKVSVSRRSTGSSIKDEVARENKVILTAETENL